MEPYGARAKHVAENALVAAREGDIESLRAALRESSRSVLQAKDRRGCAALHCAAEGGSEESVRLLLAAGADVGARNRLGETPLHIAAAYGRTACVELLLRAGADVDAKGRQQRTPLNLAACGRRDCVRLLLRAGADADAKNEVGLAPLHSAAFYGHLACIELLLRAGADKESRDGHDWTVLHLLASHGSMECAKCLLNAGADPLAAAPDPQSLVGAAVTPADVTGDAALRQLLLRAELRVRLTPLAAAAARGCSTRRCGAWWRDSWRRSEARNGRSK
jgi:ankyrin repeat protein